MARLISDDINRSDKFAALSPKAAVLFALLIPKFNSHGKMNGEPGYVKGEVCPKIPYLTVKNLAKLLKEIHDKTNVKWFKFEGLYYIHSLNFLGHQPGLRRLGKDRLPNYSRTTPGPIPEYSGPEVEVEFEVKVKGKGKEEVGRGSMKGKPKPDFLNLSLSTENTDEEGTPTMTQEEIDVRKRELADQAKRLGV